MNSTSEHGTGYFHVPREIFCRLGFGLSWVGLGSAVYVRHRGNLLVRTYLLWQLLILVRIRYYRSIRDAVME